MLNSKRTRFSGAGITVRGNDIDTDRIIPARYLKVLTFDQLDRHVFADDRNQLQEQGKLHSFDNPAFSGAKILFVNKNFGCGSSREHAPQSIHRWGIHAIIGESFGDIFLGNSVAVGMPCVIVNEDVALKLQDLVEKDSALSFTLDIEEMVVTTSDGQVFPVYIGEGPRRQFMTGGWDACGQLLEAKEKVEAMDRQLPYWFQSGRPAKN